MFLRAKRKALGFTQESLAKKSRVARITICRIESGEYKPSVPVAKRIAAVLDFDWTKFFEKS